MSNQSCKLCYRYITDLCTGTMPSYMSQGCENFCYPPLSTEVLVAEAINVCQLWNVLTEDDIEKLREALRPFIGMMIERKGE